MSHTPAPLKVAIQMDPIETIKPAVDTTFLLMLEAQARGYSLFYYTPDMLSHDGTTLTARGHDVRVYDDPDNYCTLDEARVVDLSTMDVLLMRQDPPFDMAYITATYLLETIKDQVFMVNDPTSVRDCSEKLWALTEFPDLMPPTLVSRDTEAIKTFINLHRDVILKPLYGNAGQHIIKITRHDKNLNTFLEIYNDLHKSPFMFQKYLPEILKGDKRVLMFNGDYVGSINRIPSQDENKAALAVGGRAEAYQLSSRDQLICDAVSKQLKYKNLFLTGLDIIGDYLTEINVTSPTGLKQFNALNNCNIEIEFWDKIIKQL